MNREQAKQKAQSRDCHCVKGADRDSNFNEVIDEVFDHFEKIKIIKTNIENKIKENRRLSAVCDQETSTKLIIINRGYQDCLFMINMALQSESK